MTNAKKIPEITVHGRFQPPLHINHWNYIKEAFTRAEHVTILITNPFQNETFEETASWRSDPENNPFSYDERVEMFQKFFTNMNIAAERYDFRPFNIKDDAAFLELDKSVPNLVNVYSEWSAKKVEQFEKHGLKVIQLAQAKTVPVSGTLIREIIKNNTNRAELPELLVGGGGFMPQAVQGLLDILARHDEKKGDINGT
jgi:nicotinamide mononucleotide adenylyltransferase